MRHVRIEMNGNETRLVYQRGMILEYSPVIASMPDRSWSARIDLAYTGLKNNIQYAREELRGKNDALAARETHHILNLLKRKRRVKARESFNAKKPANRAKHVGVEIEFISRSSREDIALTLAENNLTQYVELKHDGSVEGYADGGECDGSCRENCECSYCHETHYCDDETDCNSRTRNSEGRTAASHWEYREDCRECRNDGHFETIEDCDCGGYDSENNPVCNGEHVNCMGHCNGHSCEGYDDHPDYDCECECTCGNSDTGHEIAIVAKSNCIADIVTKVCKVLAEHDAEVNKTCGLHVHLDMRGFDESRAFSNLVKTQKLLYGMVPENRSNNTYCRPNISRSMAKHSGRYWGINPKSYAEHRTIEVRLHSGTVNSVKINNWIKLLQKIAYSKQKLPINVSKITDITNRIKLSNDLLNYISERVNKFDNALIINDLTPINSQIAA